jgi:hypothetical protein
VLGGITGPPYISGGYKYGDLVLQTGRVGPAGSCREVYGSRRALLLMMKMLTNCSALTKNM